MNQPALIGEPLQGLVERVTFHSPDTGFCVLQVKMRGRRELATVVGNAAAVNPGEQLECRGAWVNDATYGLQFRADTLRVIPPTTLEGVEKYLGSGLIKGIGPHFAHQLVKAFGTEVFEVIERKPERLLALDGIGTKRQARVTEAWREQKAVREIMVFLHSHGIGSARAARIHRVYGDEAIERIRENPYRLALDISGIGFITADGIARKLGIPSDSLIRIRAALHHVLWERSGEGHCALERLDLVERTVELLDVSPEAVEQAIGLEVAAENLMSESLRGEPALFLTPLFRAEAGVAGHLRRLLNGPPPWGSIDGDRVIPWVESLTGLSLSGSQREAVNIVLNGKITVLTGGPGVGKTTIVNSILRLVEARNARVLLCAPTGRAAKRLSESAQAEARTIHRLLEFDPRHGGFRKDETDPLETDLLVVDEVSMVDVLLMNQLLRAVPSHAAVLLVGDVDQLPSVGPGAVLQDVIESGQVPTVRLTEIFRQAASSSIVVNAHRINAGEPIENQDGDGLRDFYFIPAQSPEEIHDKLFQVVTERIPRRFDMNPIRDIQVLTPMNRGSLGTHSLNVELQKRLNAGAEPQVGRFGWSYAPRDKIIQTVNDYDKDVFNGDIGQVSRVDLDEGQLHVAFDDRTVLYEFSELDEISLAYATSVHKSQGSEYAAVVIPLAMQHYLLLQRNLLYTAVTRGKKLVVIIGQPRALAMAVNNVRSTRRLTNLAARLAREI
ncbi:MAG: ATP-dependent RecD-like DNA helicase [Deltaproteobacteria bacterium]|nr:ATP-dependent RecD-like DNA helicase [Deltaproteobacteria bacterium]